MEIIELIKEKPAIAYLIIRNNMNLILGLSGKPVTEDELEQGIYNLLLELDVERVDTPIKKEEMN